MADQKKRRVVLLATQLLLGEALANILSDQDDVELIGPFIPTPETIAHLSDQAPDIFVLVNEAKEVDPSLAAQILSHYPDHPMLQVSTEESLVRVTTSESHTTSSAELLETIRSLPLRPSGEDR
jgi:hypothetical protein